MIVALASLIDLLRKRQRTLSQYLQINSPRSTNLVRVSFDADGVLVHVHTSCPIYRVFLDQPKMADPRVMNANVFNGISPNTRQENGGSSLPLPLNLIALIISYVYFALFLIIKSRHRLTILAARSPLRPCPHVQNMSRVSLYDPPSALFLCILTILRLYPLRS